VSRRVRGADAGAAAPGAPPLRIGVDIGGTFTDLVFLRPDGRLDKRKVPSTPAHYAEAIVRAVDEYLREAGLPGATVGEVVHATTVATNAILERRGARTALLTTEGFRDVLELRRIRIPLVYDLGWEKPAPLVERAWRFPVRERLDARGAVLVSLDPAGVEQACDAMAAGGIEAVAICFLHAYRSPAHEQEAAAIVRRRLPGAEVSVSSEILPEIQEFERTSTTVVNAYVAPLIGRYLAALRTELLHLGVTAPILVMQSNGGLITAGTAARRPVAIIESGPAAGVVAGARVAREAGHPDVITLDMGGTTTKASLVEGGEVLRAFEYEVGAPVSVSSRLVRGSGYLLRIPVVDVSEVGAGGGSLAHVDPGGVLRVGPRSAGAVPGPVCYGLGNEAPTVTDANLVLGYLNPAALAGGTVPVDRERARKAIDGRLAEPLGLSTLEAAHGVHEVANSNMVRALKSVSVERGRDPAAFALMAFGGSGPVHAAGLARALGIRRVLVPPAAGLFSAFGLLRAEVEHHAVRTVLVASEAAEPAAIQAVLAGMRADLVGRAREEGFAEAAVCCRAFVDLRYAGQSSELTVPLPSLEVTAATLRAAEAAFEAEFERTYGHRGERRRFELVNCRMVATVAREGARPMRWPSEGPAAARAPREAYFGPGVGLVVVPVLGREDVAPAGRPGPAIVEEYDSTLVVPPDASLRRDEHGNLVVELA
jgi:N-methylhydantoinase A